MKAVFCGPDESKQTEDYLHKTFKLFRTLLNKTEVLNNNPIHSCCKVYEKQI